MAPPKNASSSALRNKPAGVVGSPVGDNCGNGGKLRHRANSGYSLTSSSVDQLDFSSICDTQVGSSYGMREVEGRGAVHASAQGYF